MFNILPPLLIILGITGLVFIFKRQSDQKGQKVIEETEEEEIKNLPAGGKKKFLEKFRRIFSKKNYQKACNQFFVFEEKFLIRSRIIILRVDRVIFKNLTKIRKRKSNGNMEEEKNGIIQSFAEEKLIENDADTSHILNTKQEEKRLLKKLENDSEDIATLKNLARIYLWQEDFFSARWTLLRAYRINKEDNVVQDLLIELYEKMSGK